MEIKFTPWRMAYISSADAPQSDACILCVRGSEEPTAANLVLFRGTSCYVLMNLYPYNTGHLMIVPYEHVSLLTDAGKPVGEVRSTAISPRLGAIALATVRREVEPGATLAVHWEGGEAQADVSAVPFPL